MIELGPPFALTDGERRHPIWIKLEARFAARLAELRGKNDGALTQEETSTLRGHIACLKEIIRLGQEPPQLDG